ncbi:MAG TPA: prenyltransferase/squalene oxidase repeat-containing protein [Planctomycetota bacterium]|nr:prenyltransferase/squalene oxidase repeat-containing protein [Planctomycetota bacterium]
MAATRLQFLHLLLIAALCGLPLAAEDAPKSGFAEIEPRQDAAIEKGLAWLAKNQNRDGSWGSHGGGGSYTMAMTGLAGLALLSGGHTPGIGKYGEHVARAVQYVLKNQNKDGVFSGGNDGRSMYGHGFAMTFLSEAYGMENNLERAEKIKDALERAVQLTSRAQSTNGGWYYSPNSGMDEGSVTITQVQALRAARNAGIDVPEKTLSRAIDYIKKSQNEDGSIRYSIHRGQSGTVALSAAGAEVLLMAGQYEAKETKLVCEYLKRNLDANRTQGYHDFYTSFYGVQAMFHIGGDYWARYFSALRDRLVKSQAGDGSWTDPTGTTYATSIAIMALALPYRYLPIFQK